MEQQMQQLTLTRARLKTPRAAAIAGIVFSVLLTTTLVLLRLSVPAISPERQDWSAIRSGTVVLALNLVPFAGIVFCGSSAWCATGSAPPRTAFLPPFFSAAGFYFWPCFLRQQLWLGQ